MEVLCIYNDIKDNDLTAGKIYKCIISTSREVIIGNDFGKLKVYKLKYFMMVGSKEWRVRQIDLIMK